jgi:hypothetical protein
LRARAGPELGNRFSSCQTRLGDELALDSLMGYAKIGITLDRYGDLMPSNEGEPVGLRPSQSSGNGGGVITGVGS